MEPIGRWKGKPRPRTTCGKSNHFKLTISFFVGFSPPSVCHIFMSFPAVTDCFHSSSIQLLGTEAFVLSYPFAPKQRSPSWIPTRRSHFPPPVLTPQHSWLRCLQALNSQLSSPIQSHFPEPPPQKRSYQLVVEPLIQQASDLQLRQLNWVCD